MDWIAILILWFAMTNQVMDNEVQDIRINTLQQHSINAQADGMIKDAKQDYEIEQLKALLRAKPQIPPKEGE